MLEQITLQRLLIEVIEKERANNPSYSLRAFSKRIGLTSSTVSEILSGKRRASLKLAKRITSGVGLDPVEEDRVLALFSSARSDALRSDDRPRLLIAADQHKLISEWFHFAILSLAETKGFSGDPTSVGTRLGIGSERARSAMGRMTRLGLLKRLPDGSVRSTGKRFKTSDEVPSALHRASHAQTFDLAKKAIYEHPIELRDCVAMTMAISPGRLPQAKQMIRKFICELSDFLEEGPKSEVYKMSIALFPLTTPQKKPKENQ